MKIKIHQAEIDLLSPDYYQEITDIESDFGIEFSCGDGLFYSDLITDISTNKDTKVTKELLEQYDSIYDYKLFRDIEGNLHSDSYLSFEYTDHEDSWNHYSDKKDFKIIKK